MESEFLKKKEELENKINDINTLEKFGINVSNRVEKKK